MAPQEKTEIIQHLERSRDEFLAAVSGLTEEQAATRPEPDRWSVLDCVEHVAFVEDRFLGWLENPKPAPAPPLDKEKEAGLLARVADRSTRINAPEAVRPTGRFGSLAQAVKQFETERARSLRAAERPASELYAVSTEHPRLGPANGMELLVIIAAHSRRHAAQIRETRALVEKN
jgi:hypothetical protein